jgi:hypothetical protein
VTQLRKMMLEDSELTSAGESLICAFGCETPPMDFRHAIRLEPGSRRHCPISNSTLDGDVLPAVETVIEYSPAGNCGTMKFTRNWPAATSAAAKTWAVEVPMVTPTPVIGIGLATTLPEGAGPKLPLVQRAA